MAGRATRRVLALLLGLLVPASAVAVVWLVGSGLSSTSAIAFGPSVAELGFIDTLPRLGVAVDGVTVRSIEELQVGSLFDPRYIARSVALYRIDCDRAVFERLVRAHEMRPADDPRIRSRWDALLAGPSGWRCELSELHATAGFDPDRPLPAGQYACAFETAASRLHLWTDEPGNRDPVLAAAVEASGLLPLRQGPSTAIPAVGIAVDGAAVRSISQIALLSDRPSARATLYRIDCERSVFDRFATAHELRPREASDLIATWKALAPSWQPPLERATEVLASPGFGDEAAAAGIQLACFFDAATSAFHLWLQDGT